jgi:hypothetical protein
VVNGYRPVLLYAGLTNYPSLACCLATLLRLLSLFTSDTKWLRHPAEHRHAAKRRYHNVRAAGRERHTPTSQLDWLISTTPMSWCLGQRRHGTCSSLSGWYSISQLQRRWFHLLAARPTASRFGRYDDQDERCKGPNQRDPLDEKGSRPDTVSERLSRPSVDGVDLSCIRAVSSQSHWAVRPIIHPF